MNIQEMHLSVQQGVDKINAQVADTLLSSELDRELNKAIQAFITTRFQQNNFYRKGFEETQKRRDDLRSLVAEARYSTNFKEQLRDATHPDGALFVDTFVLPSNYMYLINANIFIKRLPTCDPISFMIVDRDPVYYFLMSLNDFVGMNAQGTSDQWATLIGMSENLDEPEDSEFASAWSWGVGEFTSQSDPESGDPFMPTIFPNEGQGEINLVNDILNNWGLGEIFWENWNNETYPGTFIVPVDIDNFPWLNWDLSVGPVTKLFVSDLEGNTTASTDIIFQDDVTTVDGQQIGTRRLPTQDLWGTYLIENHLCRMVQHDDIHAMIGDPFNKTKYSSPLTVMRGNFIDIYTDDVFIADEVKLTYIRQPATVSLNAGVNCDLPLHTHQEIVNLAVASILETISDPRYGTHASEVQKME